MRKLLPGALPLALSLLVWLPLAFLGGGSLMSALELSGYLGPVLSDTPGYAFWRLLPCYPTLAPYVELLLDSPEFFVMFWNSVKLAAGSLLGQTFVAIPAAWWFARCSGRRSRGLFTLYIILMLMPFQVTMVSSYLVMDGTGLLDTHWSILLPAIFSTFPIFIMHRFFKAIPQSVIEAAQIDGASSWQIFFHIGLPMGKNGVAAAMVLGFLEYWNLIEQPMTFLKSKTLWPLSLYLPQITAGKIGLALAASVITLLPSILVFLYGQSYLEQGIMASGAKE
ncbi:carbohydrate ABC transporter permease [Oscillospiraceae bacterium MB08-C2-2]|nr:carbohydrate ABC transporter permease [Oscillospiraceae bacterium MB08-C2-2]